MSWFARIWDLSRWFARKATVPALGQGGHISKPYAYASAGSFESGAKYIDGLHELQAVTGLRLDHERVREKARTAYHDSSLARAAVDRFATMGISTGLFLEAVPQADLLGRADDELADWAWDVQRRFHLWARDKNSHIEQSLTLYQLQRFLVTSQQRDGEYFVRLHYVDGQVKFGTFDPSQIEEGYVGQTAYDDGVHRDRNGMVDGYRIRVAADRAVVFPAFTRDGKPLILHGYMPDYSGQVRGISQIAHILQECKLLSDYQINELIKAGLQAALNIWVKPSQDAPATNIMDGLAVQAGPMAGYDEDSLPAEPGGNTDAVTYKRMDEAPAMAGGIGVFNLNAGEELKAFQASSPSEAYSPFTSTVKEALFSSINMPPEIGKLSFNSNYSASQAALILFWDVLQMWRDELASDFLNILYEAWLNNEIAEGRVTCPGWTDPVLRKAWAYCEWTGRGRPQIDPEKQGRGYKEFVELGAKTLEEISRETNGSSARMNRAKLRRELAELPSVPWQKQPAAAVSREDSR